MPTFPFQTLEGEIEKRLLVSKETTKTNNRFKNFVIEESNYSWEKFVSIFTSFLEEMDDSEQELSKNKREFLS